MERSKIDIEKMPRENRYKVPEGYFSDLNHRIMDQVEAQQEAGSIGFGGALRRMVGVVGGFAALVLIAVTGFYFTGYQTRQAEIAMAGDYDVNLHYVTIDDIMEWDADDSEADARFVEAAYAYLDTYGYNSSDLVDIYNSTN